jgi:hypothetical protein
MELTKIWEILIALFVVGYLFAATIRSPRLGLVVWLAVTCFVPSWLLVRVELLWTPAGLCALLVLPVIFVRGPRAGLRAGDVVAVGIVLLCLYAYLQGKSPRELSDAIIVRGLLAYVVSRCLAARAGLGWAASALAMILLICAAWSIVEYALNLHIFEHFDLSSAEGSWAAIQYRGHHARSEAAFGDAIALGAALAMAVPFIFAASWRVSRKLAALTLIGVGILATTSRGPMTAALLGIVLMVVLYRGAGISGRQRTAITLVILVVSAVLYVGLVAKLSAAGSEASNSAAYRGKLYSYVLEDIRPFSLADHVTYTRNQETYRQFHSIDSTFIYVALFYGWVPAAVFIFALLILVRRALRLRAGPAAIAMLAQIPVLATVAPITQYETLLWFLGGLVVAEAAPSRYRARKRIRSIALDAAPPSPPSVVPVS